MSWFRKPLPMRAHRGLEMLHHLYYYCSSVLILDAFQAEGSRPPPDPGPAGAGLSTRPRPSRPAPGPAPADPAPLRALASTPAPPGLPRPTRTALFRLSQSAKIRGAVPQAPTLLSGRQLVNPSVAHEVAPRTRLPPFPLPSPSEKTAVGLRRPPKAD